MKKRSLSLVVVLLVIGLISLSTSCAIVFSELGFTALMKGSVWMLLELNFGKGIAAILLDMLGLGCFAGARIAIQN